MQSSMFSSQYLPVYPAVQEQVKLFMESWQVALLEHGSAKHSLISSSQYLPKKPLLQLQWKPVNKFPQTPFCVQFASLQ